MMEGSDSWGAGIMVKTSWFLVVSVYGLVIAANKQKHLIFLVLLRTLLCSCSSGHDYN